MGSTIIFYNINGKPTKNLYNYKYKKINLNNIINLYWKIKTKIKKIIKKTYKSIK